LSEYLRVVLKVLESDVVAFAHLGKDGAKLFFVFRRLRVGLAV
jgi:hypothetical protein